MGCAKKIQLHKDNSSIFISVRGFGPLPSSTQVWWKLFCLFCLVMMIILKGIPSDLSDYQTLIQDSAKFAWISSVHCSSCGYICQPILAFCPPAFFSVIQLLFDFVHHFFKRGGQDREGKALPPSGTRGKTSPSTEQDGHSHSQALGGNRKKTPHTPMVLKLSRHQEDEIKLGRKALPPSPVSPCGSPHPLLPLAANPHQHQNHLTLLPWQRGFLHGCSHKPTKYFLHFVQTGFPLFKTPPVVNPHTEEGCSQAFVFPRHIPLNSLLQHWEQKWFRTQSWL